MTKMLKSIIAGAAVLIGACFIGQTQPVQAADDYALRLAEDNQWYYYQDDEVDTCLLYTSIVKYAEKFLGTPYTWGGTSPDTGFDCSGFTQYVYSNFGIDLDLSLIHILYQNNTSIHQYTALHTAFFL